jgi:hypothetical protein
MSKPLGYEPIHESNLTKNRNYFLKIKQWGEGLVQVHEITMNGTSVEVVDGGFDTPLKKVRSGHVFLVPNGVGQFYEAAA